MKVKVAETAGFCFGVKRAVNKVYELIDTEQKPIFTLGPIIHNEGVVADLEARGVHVIAEADLDSPDDTLQNGTVVIRSHGVGKAIYDKLKEKNISYVDVTCPFVLKIHRIVEKESLAGNHIIIIGDKDHPEVQGICGWCQGPYTVIRNKEEAEAFVPPKGKKISIVSQTTFNYNKFKDLVEILCKKRYDNNVLNILNILNTICNATEERQREAKNIAGEVDTMLVVGGRHSSNTQKLFEICKKECGNTYYIQTPVDLDSEMFQCSSYVGITAGASTQTKLLRRFKNMSELSFEQMLEDSVKTIRNGEIVQGTVIDVKEDEIILNIGYKADGIITKNEYSNDASLVLTDAVHVGDTMEAKVLKVNDGEGQVTLTYKRLAAEKGNKRLEEAFENQEVLKAPVTQVLDGGLCVNVDEARVFIPASLVSDTYEKDLSKYADQEIEFVITEFNPRRRRIIGNRKQLLLAEKAEKQKELMERIHVGDTVEGTVKNVTDFGAFIDLGGADGLLHISEMSWGRVENPKKVFTVGDKVKVLIKEINGEKIALSLKFPEANPWLTAAEDFAVGNVVKGKVARMTDFGAFVELAPGVDALLHVSQISREHVAKPADVLSIGQEIEAKVVDFNGEDKKISLSMKALEAPAEEATEE